MGKGLEGILNIRRELAGLRTWLASNPQARPIAGTNFMECYLGNCIAKKGRVEAVKLAYGKPKRKYGQKPYRPFDAYRKADNFMESAI